MQQYLFTIWSLYHFPFSMILQIVMCRAEGRKALQCVVTNHPVLFSKNGQVLFYTLGQKENFWNFPRIVCMPMQKSFIFRVNKIIVSPPNWLITLNCCSPKCIGNPIPYCPSSPPACARLAGSMGFKWLVKPRRLSQGENARLWRDVLDFKCWLSLITQESGLSSSVK